MRPEFLLNFLQVFGITVENEQLNLGGIRLADTVRIINAKLRVGMIGIDESFNFNSDEREFDAPTRPMNKARSGHNLYVVTPRSVRSSSSAVPARRTPAVTILDKTVIASERCNIAAAASAVSEIRERSVADPFETPEVETSDRTAGFSSTGLIAAGLCGLVVGLLLSRRSG